VVCGETDRLHAVAGLNFSPFTHFPFQVDGIGFMPCSSLKLSESGHIPYHKTSMHIIYTLSKDSGDQLPVKLIRIDW
jgi:hypothetical protein